jgi:hypothetical protein
MRLPSECPEDTKSKIPLLVENEPMKDDVYAATHYIKTLVVIRRMGELVQQLDCWPNHS